MQVLTMRKPITEIPIGPKLYPVATLTADICKSRRAENDILANSGGKPLIGEIAIAYVAIIRTLIAGDHPELTDDYVRPWLSEFLCNMAAFEWMRQNFRFIRMPSA